MSKKKSQKKTYSKGENPFNVKVNRSKFSVIGQKVRGTRGLPGISHSLCNAKRKEDFHKKRLESQKANKFVDKRFMNSSLSHEEQATLRLVEERKKKLKKNIFNLNDDESLTHKGVPLENLKNLSETMNDSDDEEQLDSKFVKHAHFGGFTDDSSSAPKSRQEIIDELIVESKRRKMEKKMVREKNEELIDQLDQQWKTMHHKLIPAMKAKNQKMESEKKDPFDILLNELKFEMRTAPPIREKTAEEIAREESEKMKKLEEERNKRMMNPMDFGESKDNLLSADSLYDGLDIELEPIIDEPENVNVNLSSNENSDDEESGDESSVDSENEKDVDSDRMEDAKTEPDLTIDDDTDFPDTVEKLCALISNQSEELYVVLDNVISKKIKSKSKQNLEKLRTLFSVLIDYILNSDYNTSKIFELLDEILPHMYTLAEVSPLETAEKLLCFLDEEQENFQQSKGKKMKKNFPRRQCLVLFKIVSAIYSVSDFQHPVVTPAMIFMCDILKSPHIATFQNTYSRIFISKIMYDCVSFSKRYVPEALWFLNRTLELALHNNKKFNLFIEDKSFEGPVELNFEKSDKSCDHSVKVTMISEIIELLHKFAILYEYLQCCKESFSFSIDVLSKIVMMDNFATYPSCLKKVISDFNTFVEKIKKIYKPLVFENKKPVPLKLFEPAFECKLTKRKDDIQKKRKLIKSVNKKIRKEEKGQLREMRRNNQVIASEKLREKLEADEERKRKVKQLYQELAMQEGEYKKFMKKK